MFSLYVMAWTASIIYGTEAVFAKMISKHSIGNQWLFNFAWNLFILIGTAIIALWFGVGIPAQWTYIILGSLAFAVGATLYTLVIYKLDVSVIGPMFSFRTVMAVLVGAFFLGEVLTTNQYLLIGIIFISGMFVTMDERFTLKSFFNKWVFILLFDMLCFVFLATFMKKAVAVEGFWNATVWVAFLGQIWMLPSIFLFKKDVIQTTFKQYGYVALLAFIGIFGTLAANAAYAENVSIAATIISIPISMIVAFMFSAFAPNLLEKHTLKIYAIRFTAAAVMIVAALNL